MSSHEDRFEVHQEPDRLHGRSVRLVVVASLIVGVAGVVVSAAFLPRAPEDARAKPPPVAPSQIATVEQTLFATTSRGLDQRRRELDELSRWGWVDRDAGVARIPVDVAMRIVAEEKR